MTGQPKPEPEPEPEPRPKPPPTVADCLRFASQPGAVQVVLNSTHDMDKLREWTEGVADAGARPMTAAEVARWTAYGELFHSTNAGDRYDII